MSDEDFVDRNPQKDLLAVIGYWVFIIIFVLIGFYSLTAGQALDIGKPLDQNVEFVKFVVLTISLVTYGVFATVIKFANHLGERFDWLVAIIHDPELGVFPWLKLVSNPFNLVVVSLLVFSTMGFVGVMAKNITGQDTVSNALFPFSPGNVEQQATPGAKLFFGLYNAPTENAWLWIMMMLTFAAELVLVKKLGLPMRTAFIFLIFFNSIFFAFAWLQIHTLVTQNEKQTISHFIFGFNMSLITQLTGSIIPGEVYHLTNNLFNSLITLFSGEVALLVFSLLLILSWVGGGYYLYRQLRKED